MDSAVQCGALWPPMETARLTITNHNPVVVADGGDGERAGAAPDGGRGAGRGGGGGPAGGGGAGSRTAAAAAVVQLLRPGPAGGGQHPRHHDGAAGEGAGSTRPGLEEIVWKRNKYLCENNCISLPSDTPNFR